MRPAHCALRRFLLFPLAALSACTMSVTTHPPTLELKSDEKQHQVERSDPWLLIESGADRLTVFQQGKPSLVLNNIAFGAAGVNDKRRRGDDVTPRGVYRVAWIRRQSKFLHFIGLNYPSLADAQRGLKDGRIDQQTFDRIKLSHLRGDIPPQDTPLGGHIGIHGVGKGRLDIHRVANWTAGCVAVENNQIKRLTETVRIGTVVEIR